MKPIYNICAFAQNTVWNKSHDMVLNSDDKLVDASHDAQEFRSAEHAISFIKQHGQALADKCAAHTQVEFFVVKHEVDGEGEPHSATVYSQIFNVLGRD